MTNKTVVFFATMFLTAVSAQAQSQEGSVAIASSVKPIGGDTTQADFAKCVVSLVKEAGVVAKEAVESCRKVSVAVVRGSEGIANSAQKAAQASRPVVVTPAYGYGSYNTAYGSYH